MSLLNIAGATNMNIALQLALVFLYTKTEEDYIWALTSLQEMLGPDGNSPSVMVTGRERALVSACQTVFSQVHHILCRWHVGKSAPKPCKKKLYNRRGLGNVLCPMKIQSLIASPKKNMRFS